MAIYPSLTVAYAKAIYMDGTKRFSDIRAEYVTPVMQYAANHYEQSIVITAKANGWITEAEQDATLALY